MRPDLSRSFTRNVVMILAFLLMGTGQSSLGAAKKLRVATRHTPPFAIKDKDGHWSGISIDLWRGIASELKLEYEFVEMDLKEMLYALEEKQVDIAVAALTVTAEREEKFDFSHPFYSSGLGIAIKPEKTSGLMAVMRKLFSWELLQFVGAIILTMIVLGSMIYLLERRHNPEQFEKGLIRGVFSGIWWSAVTMTTVGYGDKAPQSFPGRVLAMVWMFTGIILIATFTAVVTSALTVRELQSPVQGLDDLYHVRVTCVEESTGDQFLQHLHIPARSVQSANQALESLSRGECDAVVYDAPILRYLAYHDHEKRLDVLPLTLDREDYGLALPSKSKLREPCNRALLRLITSEGWKDRLKKYLGP